MKLLKRPGNDTGTLTSEILSCPLNSETCILVYIKADFLSLQKLLATTVFQKKAVK